MQSERERECESKVTVMIECFFSVCGWTLAENMIRIDTIRRSHHHSLFVVIVDVVIFAHHHCCLSSSSSSSSLRETIMCNIICVHGERRAVCVCDVRMSEDEKYQIALFLFLPLYVLFRLPFPWLGLTFISFTPFFLSLYFIQLYSFTFVFLKL